MRGIDEYLLKAISQERQLRMPLYQRRYAWGKNERSKLLRDLIAVGSSSQINAEHFLGSLIIVDVGPAPMGSLTVSNVVDGQQRLVTVSLLIAALANRASASDEDKRFKEQYLINATRSGTEKYRLQLNALDTAVYQAAIDDDGSGSGLTRFANSLVAENYQYFLLQVADIDKRDAVRRGLPRIKIISTILTPPIDNVHRTFESINSTGKPLTQFDLIRNFLLMDLSLDAQDEIYKSHWASIEKLFDRYNIVTPGAVDSFVREYLGIKLGRKPLKDSIYEDYIQFASASNLTRHELAADLKTWSLLYPICAFNENFSGDVGFKLKSQLLDLATAGGDQFVGLAMQCLHQVQNGLLSVDDACSILAMFESYIVRRYICGVPTNARNKVIGRILLDLKFRGTLTVRSVVRQFKFANRVEVQRSPSDQEVASSVLAQPLYMARGSNLNWLIRKLGNHGNKEQVISLEYSVEHVMPQSKTDEWRNDIGEHYETIFAKHVNTLPNLTLVASNAQLGNRSFLDKRDLPEGGYAASAFPLNRWIAEQEKWDDETFARRADILTNQINKIWADPASGIADESMSGWEGFISDLPAAVRDRYDNLMAAVESFDVLAVGNSLERIEIIAEGIPFAFLDKVGSLTIKFRSLADIEAFSSAESRASVARELLSTLGSSQQRKNAIDIESNIEFSIIGQKPENLRQAVIVIASRISAELDEDQGSIIT